MLDSSLTADVPLGPFEGTPVTVHSAKGKSAKLHTNPACTQLRTRDVTTTEAPLNADTVGRMCSRCAQWGDWARPETGLGIFLRALSGFGLLHELSSHTGPDEETDWETSELQAAADLLCVAEEPLRSDDEDEEDGEALEEAERLWGQVLATWRLAADSLHRAESTSAMFSWLTSWAEPKLAVKRQYLEVLRGQAAVFVDPDGLLEAAAAALLDEPELPVGEQDFAAIGIQEEITRSLKTLWERWQDKASRGWRRPDGPSVAFSLTRGMRPNRKGRTEARAAADNLVASWQSLARDAVRAADPAPRHLVTAHLPGPADDSPHRHGRELFDGLDDWTTGVLLTHLADADWGRRTLTLKVPRLIADRLLTSSLLPCEPRTADAGATAGGEADGALPVVRPGIFDDTPVHDRQPLAAGHLRALRTVSARAEHQLYLVFSTDGGAEVLMLPTVEKRLAAGWRGTVIAGSADLPASVIEEWIREIGPSPEDRDGARPSPARDPHDPRFGQDLGLADGARSTAWWRFGEENLEHDLRCLAMARGAADLRTLDGGRDRAGHRRSVSSEVWDGLLADARWLDLEPFTEPGAGRRQGGSGVPLGILADVQVYTTDADPRTEGKGHSPFCQHSRERGVTAHDDLLTLADLLTRDDFDWCGKCRGFAVRRLTDDQLSYYRVAHRLHDLVGKLTPKAGGADQTDMEVLAAHLSEVSDWHPAGERYWDGSDAWRWREIIRGLRHDLSRRRDDQRT